MHLRKVPERKFFADDRFNAASQIEELLKKPGVLRDINKDKKEKIDGFQK